MTKYTRFFTLLRMANKTTFISMIYKMKKYLQFLKYAFKEQRQYRTNFFVSIGTMLFNDACFTVIFLLFLWYFTDTWLTFGNFLALFSTSCVWYGVVHGLFSNIWRLPEIIEQWKLDYYLSFPIDPLYFLSSTKIWIADMWDIVFGLICMGIYAFWFADNSRIVLIKALAVLILTAVVIFGIYIIIGSVSFWLQKWSKLQDLFNTMFVSFSQYPPEIYRENKLVYVFMCLLLFPGMILPYMMIIWATALRQWIIMVWFAILMPIVWVRVFKRWLKRYSSGNLVHQM